MFCMIKQSAIGLNSRSEANPYNKEGFLPLITAPMYSVVDNTNYQVFLDNKIQVCLPRNKTIMFSDKYFSAMSLLEFKESFITNAKWHLDLNKVTKICIDTANGNMPKLHEAIKKAKEIHKERLVIMAGNVSSVEAFAALAKTGVDYIRVGVGGGCLAEDTRILMREGWCKNIKNINVGDYVINGEGNPVKVIGVKYSGLKKVVKHKHNRFYKPTFVTPEHLHWGLPTSRLENFNNGYKKFIEKKETEIGWYGLKDNEKALYFLPKKINYSLPPDFYIDISNYIYSSKTELTKTNIYSSYKTGYLFGTFLGDGNSSIIRKQSINRINSSGQVTWYFNITERNYANKVSEYIKDVFDLHTKEEILENVIKVHVYCQPLARFFREFYTEDKKKKLPEQFYCLNKEYLQGLYDGLIDSDGTWGNEKDSRDSFTNTSFHLIELLNFINNVLFENHANNEFAEARLTTFGLSSSFKWRKNKVEERREFNNFSIVKSLYIDKVEEIIDTYDIEVDCPTHSFIANNCIVHNSACNTTSNTGVGQEDLEELISECYRIKEINKKNIEYFELNKFSTEAVAYNITNVKIVADGISTYIKQCQEKYGFNDNGYAAINKLLYAGADLVMIGGLFAQCLESAGDKTSKIRHNSGENWIASGKAVFEIWNNENDELMVKYSGMSTHEEQSKYRKPELIGGTNDTGPIYNYENYRPSEGSVKWTPVRWTLGEWLNGSDNQDDPPYLMGWVNSLKSAMSYVGSTTLEKYRNG